MEYWKVAVYPHFFLTCSQSMFYRMCNLVIWTVELNSSQGTEYDLDYGDEIVLLSDGAQAIQRALVGTSSEQSLGASSCVGCR